MRKQSGFPAAPIAVVVALLIVGILFTTFPLAPSTWISRAQTLDYHYFHQAQPYGNGYAVFGGATGHYPDLTTDVYFYSPLSNAWSKISQIPSGVGVYGYASTGLPDRSVIISGGRPYPLPPNSNYASDQNALFANGVWYVLPSIPALGGYTGEVQEHQIAFVEPYLYLFGGSWRIDGTPDADYLPRVLRCHYTTGVWEEMTSMPNLRYMGASVLVNNNVYWFGGRIKVSGTWVLGDAVWRYSIALDSWAQVSTQPVYHSQTQITAYGSEVIIPGGFVGGSTRTTRVSVYDTATGVWGTLPDLPLPLQYPAVATVGDSVYVAGGWYSSWYERENYAMLLTKTPPVAVVEGNKYINEDNSVVTFNGGGSYDPDGTIVNYTWSFGDGKFGYGQVVSHNYTVMQNYTYHLTVTDDDGLTGVASALVFYDPLYVPDTDEGAMNGDDPPVQIPDTLWYILGGLAIVGIGGVLYGFVKYPRKREIGAVLWASPSLLYVGMLIWLIIDQAEGWLYQAESLQIVVIALPAIAWGIMVGAHHSRSASEPAVSPPEQAPAAGYGYPPHYRRQRGKRG